MEVNTETPSSKSISSFLIFCIFILAFVIRIYHINSPPLDFEPERQYHSLMLSRSFFLESSNSAPEWRKKLWQLNRSDEYIAEPPIIEHLVSFGYRLLGKEQFWVSRSLSVVFWLAGGWILFLLISKFFGKDAAAICCVYYLFNTFGITASRSFMPNPLMILLVLLALSSFVKYAENPKFSFIVPGLLSGIAVLIKPFCIIFLPLTFLFVCIQSRKKIREVLYQFGMFVIVVGIIALPFYLFGSSEGRNFTKAYATNSFLPRLWFKPYFWGGWFDLIRMTAGYIPFIIALFGLLFVQNGVSRMLLAGMWLSYLCFGLLFTYHIHTHDYYHLILIPLIALSLAPLAMALMNSWQSQQRPKFFGWIIAGILIFATAASIHETRSRWKMVEDYINNEVSKAIEIGETLNHSAEVLSLAPHYAKPLKYHAEIAGKRWPYSYDFRANEIMQLRNTSAAERLAEYQKLYSPKYFVVSDFDELNRQQDLKSLLYNKFPVVKQTNSYVIFSLSPVTR